MRKQINNRIFAWVNEILDHSKVLDKDALFRIINRQLIRSCTSVGANYRASGRAKSLADMINKLKITEEELDETIYWLELIQHRSELDFKKEIQEANELLSIVVASIKSLRKKTN